MSSDIEKFVESWKRRMELETIRMKAQASEARRAAEKSARILAEEFQATRVVLFGSLARGEFAMGSDIDLAVFGLKPADYFKALVRIEEGHELEINLVPYESAFEHIRKSIDEGIVLHETDDTVEIRLLRLKSEITSELDVAGTIADEVEELVRSRPIPEKYHIQVLALLIHNFYCCVENIFLRIAPVLNGGTPGGGDFHRRLLENMKMRIEGVRPAVITKETFKLLAELMKFRHVVRHMYAFDLDLEKVESLASRIKPAFESLDKDASTFVSFIEELCEGMGGERQ